MNPYVLQIQRQLRACLEHQLKKKNQHHTYILIPNIFRLNSNKHVKQA